MLLIWATKMVTIFLPVSFAFHVGEFVGVHYEGLAVVFGDHVKNDTGDDEQESDDDQHDGADERGEVGDHAGAHELRGDPAAQNQSDDSDEQAKSSEERQRLVFADHAEDGAHDLDAVAHRVELGHGAGGPVAVLYGHFVQSQVVVQRVDGHFRLDLEAAREHGVGFDEGEAERAVTGHDVSDVRAEQVVDGAADKAVAEVVERTLVLLEVCGGEAVADDHVVAFEHLGNHAGRSVGGVGVVAVGHHVHVRVDVFEHGADDVAFALAWLLAYDGTFRSGDLGGAVGGVVVVYVDGRVGQRRTEVAHHLADGHLFVIARQQHGDGWVLLFRHDFNIYIYVNKMWPFVREWSSERCSPTFLVAFPVRSTPEREAFQGLGNGFIVREQPKTCIIGEVYAIGKR